MSFSIRVALALAVVAALATSSTGAGSPVKPKVIVEFRWLESKPIKGVTEESGSPIVCDGADWYPHLKPVLTSKDIATARLMHLKLGLDQYLVEFTLTKEATKKLAAECGDDPGRMLTVYAYGKTWGASHFEKAKADEFSAPGAGFTTSKELAEEILEASK